jgi:hypothetical protein
MTKRLRQDSECEHKKVERIVHLDIDPEEEKDVEEVEDGEMSDVYEEDATEQQDTSKTKSTSACLYVTRSVGPPFTRVRKHWLYTLLAVHNFTGSHFFLLLAGLPLFHVFALGACEACLSSQTQGMLVAPCEKQITIFFCRRDTCQGLSKCKIMQKLCASYPKSSDKQICSPCSMSLWHEKT